MEAMHQTLKTGTNRVFSSANKKNKENSFFPQKNGKTSFFGSAGVQPKLQMGQPNDPYEHEADRIADQVMRMPEAGIKKKCTACDQEEKVQRKPLVQLKASGHSNRSRTASPDIANKIAATKGFGRSLPKSMQYEMGSKMGADFSGVKVHTSNTAVQLNEELGAKAFTVGNDIYFNKGQYNPTSADGKRLMVHELVHTVQQNLPSGVNNLNNSSLHKQPDPDSQPVWCSPLTELVSYELRNGTLNTIMRYNPANDDLLIPLNQDIPSIHGLVDIDWMLRLTYTQVPTIIPSVISPAIAEGSGILLSHLHYFGAKTLWNMLRSVSEVYDLEFSSVMQGANLNAPSVVVNWVHGQSLQEIFEPALKMCK